MERNRRLGRGLTQRVGAETRLSAAVMLLAMAVVGCSDHRISLYTFMKLQDDLAKSSQPAATQPSTSQPARDPLIDSALGPYKVGPSDVLEIVLIQPQGEQGVAPLLARVDRDGNVELPLVGKVKVAGMELEDVEQAIKNAYVPEYYRETTIHVAVALPNATNVLVIGAVTDPGLIKLRRTDRNLLHAIVVAGGVSDAASGEVTLQRLRRPDEVMTLNLRDPEQLKAALVLDPLENGDIVTVKAAAPNTIYVGGLVNAAQPLVFPMGVGVTVLQAIAGAGGLRTDLTPREATLIRRMQDGEDVHVKLNLDRIGTGKDPNIKLASGDILWVPHTVETRVQEWVNRNIYLRAGVAATVNYNVTGIEYLNRHGQQGATGGGGDNLEGSFDPLGFLNRNTALRGLQLGP
jgi:polysaccharide export outer membrane protein